MNDIEELIHWYKIKITMPKVKEFADDSAPTIDKIRKLVEYNDIKIKLMVYNGFVGNKTGCFGISQVEACCFDEMKMTLSMFKATKLVVYAGEPEQYYTFITFEGFQSRALDGFKKTSG